MNEHVETGATTFRLDVSRLVASLCCCLLISSGVTNHATAAELPNFVLIMADDLGYGELGCYGSQTFQTPHLDELARTGLRLTDYHSNGVVCSPTRAAMMTGRYQQRSGIDGVVTALAHRETGLDLEEQTLPELLGQAGYASAIFGKWHLGYATEFNPTKQGFDRFQGFVSGNIDLVSHVDQQGWFDWWQADQLDGLVGYTPHHITDAGIEFIREHQQQPFLLYLAHPAPHYPYQGPNDKAIRRVTQGPIPEGWIQPETVAALPRDESGQAYREMVEDLDAQVGRIVQELESLGLRDNTLIVFCSDNGGVANPRLGSDNGPLRGAKGQIYEGGHRVAGIFNWPDKITPGVSDETIVSFDLMPTFAELAQVTAARDLDGTSLVAHLFNREPIPTRPLLWLTGNRTALRLGDWKLVDRGATPELYHLGDDLSEAHDLATEQAERVDAMMQQARELRESIRGTVEMRTGS